VSTAEILDKLSELSPVELNVVDQRILELEESHVIEPSEEFSAAIEEGPQSMRTEPAVSLEEARRKISEWAGQSA
jgi:hypothetical protein